MNTVITAVSSNMWADYLLFYQSLHRFNKVLLRVIAIDLNSNQLQFINSQEDVSCNVLPKIVSRKLLAIGKDWKKWYKPLFISHVDSGNALWIDCDTIIAGPLNELFEVVAKQFFVINEIYNPKESVNDDMVYERLGIPIPSKSVSINSGVIGFDLTRDKDIVDQWHQNVQLAQKDHMFAHGLSFYDQGALLLTVHQLGLVDNIIHKPQWNQPAKRFVYGSSHDIIGAVKNDHPNALIIHFLGGLKLSQLRPNANKANGFISWFGNVPRQRWFLSGMNPNLRDIYTDLRASMNGGWCSYSNNSEPADEWGQPDCPVSITIGPNLNLKAIKARWQDAKLGIVIRDPAAAVQDWLEVDQIEATDEAVFTCWDRLVKKLHEWMQQDAVIINNSVDMVKLVNHSKVLPTTWPAVRVCGSNLLPYQRSKIVSDFYRLMALYGQPQLIDILSLHP